MLWDPQEPEHAHLDTSAQTDALVLIRVIGWVLLIASPVCTAVVIALLVSGGG